MNPWVVVQILAWALQGLFCIVVIILGWNVRTQIGRIERLEEQKADKDDLAELKQDMKDHRQETRDSFTRLFDRLDTIADRWPAKGVKG